MREAEFKAWLEARRWNGKPLTSISSRMSKARRFERAMPALGLGHADLDAAFDADGMHAVTERLRDWCREAASTGAAPAELVGQTTSAAMRISNVASAVRNYRQFRESATGGASPWPALDELRSIFLDRVPEFERFDLPDNAYERIERAYKDALIARVREIAESPDDDERAGRRIYRALIPSEGALLSWQVEDDFTRKFASMAPTFFTVVGRLARSAGSAVDAIMAAAGDLERLYEQGAASLTLGQVARITLTVGAMAHPDQAAPFAITKAQRLAKLLTDDPIFAGTTLTRAMVEQWLDLLRRIAVVMRDEWQWAPRDLIDVQGFAWTALDDRWGDPDQPDEDTPIWLVTARDGEEDGVAHYRERGEWHLLEDRDGRANALVREMTPGDRIVLRDYFGQKHDLPFDARGQRVTAMRIRATGTVTEQRDDGISVGVAWDPPIEPRTWYFYTNNDPVWRLRPEPEMARRLAAFIFEGAAQDYDWFVARWFEDQQKETSESIMPSPTNLILYGPPGTGKTYATARHAVKLCDGLAADDPLLAPAGREALMARYRKLEQENRVRFVTFHQNFAYEEFVEGLRPEAAPETGEDNTKAASNTGFSLVVKPGIFRDVCALAEKARSVGIGTASTGTIDLTTRRFWKMGIGAVGSEDDVYQAALRGDYVALGWGADVDWGDLKFADLSEMRSEWQRRYPADAFPEMQQPSHIGQPWKLRNEVKRGDIIIVPSGNSAFRAVAEVVGDYYFELGEGGVYNQRRKVRWLLKLDEPLQLDAIVTGDFTMRTLYGIDERRINKPALAALISGEQDPAGSPLPCVLVIDEINRANISKVFGELITLLERDKRVGKPGALTVRLPYSRKEFGVPANLHIVGTMNTADRSIALLDTALRRRFTFEELMPDPRLLTTVEGINLQAVLTTLNDRIEYLFDREHQIGHAYFLPCQTRDDVDEVMRHKVIPLLQEYFYEDWTKVAAVLGDVFEDNGRTEEGGFLIRTPLASPFGKGTDGEGEEGRTRYRWTVRAPATFTYAGLGG